MKCLSKWQSALDWNACYFENHDQPRFISRFDDLGPYRKEASKMMAGLQMTLRGTPYMHEGQEIGMTNGDFANLDEVEDIESHNIWAMAKKLGIPKGIRWKMIQRTSRDNGRTPMQWTAGENAGFTSGKPWLKVNGNHTEVNVETEKRDPNGVLAFWKQMIALRKTHPVLIDGSFRSVYEGRAVYVFARELEGKTLLSVCNLTGKNAKLPKVVNKDSKLIACNYQNPDQDTLKPFEFRLLEIEK
jgi:oligo-1,6-glucosidase